VIVGGLAAESLVNVRARRGWAALFRDSLTIRGGSLMVTRRQFIGAAGMLSIALGSGLVTPSAVQARPDGTLKFEIYKDNAKEFRWRLKAANGAILATSGQGYKAKADSSSASKRTSPGTS
jgi:uncharacterized protein YegP (UPF0339 family)